MWGGENKVYSQPWGEPVHGLLSVLSLTQKGLSCCTFRQKVSMFADCEP